MSEPTSITPETRRLFGIPVGDFGFFATLLVSASTMMLTFFAGTFLAIVGVSIYKGITHSPVSLNISYKYISAPLALVVGVAAFIYFITIWAQRKLRS